MSRGATVLTALALGVVLAAAFWWLDFTAVHAESSAETRTATVRFGRGGEPAWPQDGMAIYVAGNSDLSQAVADELIRCFEASPTFGPLEVLDSKPEAVRRPIMVVEVEELNTIWTPVYGRTWLVVTAAYASDGDLSWWHQPVVATTLNGPAFWADSRVELSDTTYGLFSHRAYERQLGEKAAVELSKQLESVLNNASAQEQSDSDGE